MEQYYIKPKVLWNAGFDSPFIDADVWKENGITYRQNFNGDIGAIEDRNIGRYLKHRSRKENIRRGVSIGKWAIIRNSSFVNVFEKG